MTLNFDDQYFRMTEEEVIIYAKNKQLFYSPDASLSCKEIGDGNLNYVFRVVDESNKKSIIIKQAGPVARISDEFKLSTDRTRIESEILILHNQLAPGFAPEVFLYDPVMNCCVMEDLSDHVILRTGLLNFEVYPRFADHITTFLAQTLLQTSDLVMGHKEKKALLKSYINPELCEISEDLVFTEPFFDCGRNDMLPETKEFAKKYLWQDSRLLLETAKLKFDFMTNGQALIHGDLHTGSIFVNKESTKIIDPEFAFYGPAGYDIGNVIAHFIFAHTHAKFAMEEGQKKQDYLNWLEETIVEIVDQFKEKFLNLYNQKVTERVGSYDGFREYYLDTILRDTAATVGLELCRRVVGIAHVKDITSIEPEEKRHQAEVFCLTLGKEFILNRDSYKLGEQYKNLLGMETMSLKG